MLNYVIHNGINITLWPCVFPRMQLTRHYRGRNQNRKMNYVGNIDGKISDMSWEIFHNVMYIAWLTAHSVVQGLKSPTTLALV